MTRFFLISAIVALVAASCGGTKRDAADGRQATAVQVGPEFSADSAYAFCHQQCSFGPRTMNSEAHELCGQWIVGKFQSYGMKVTEQRATLRGYDGTPLMANNIIAAHRPEAQHRVMVCAHWDSRPWADNDPDPDNWHKPVMAANDGASGVAVMIELARLLCADTAQAGRCNIGVDFVCFDAEDWGTPQWSDLPDDSDSWALGAQHWAATRGQDTPKPRYAVLLDMVGGQGARFYREGYSMKHAAHVVDKVWRAAQTVGVGSLFPSQDGGWITDDHVPVNQVAGIDCIDIIAYYPDCAESSFGPTWHTLSDDMQHIDRATLKAVGQTLVQVLWSEQ